MAWLLQEENPQKRLNFKERVLDHADVLIVAFGLADVLQIPDVVLFGGDCIHAGVRSPGLVSRGQGRQIDPRHRAWRPCQSSSLLHPSS